MKNFTQLLLDILKVIFGIFLVLVALLLWMDNTVEKDRELRTYISEGLAIATVAKLASTDFYEIEKTFPNNNQEAGMSEPDQITGQSVKSIEILPKGRIKITYNNKLADNAFIILEAILDDKDKIIWQCREAGLLEMKVIPANCRGQIDEFNTQNNIDHP